MFVDSADLSSITTSSLKPTIHIKKFKKVYKETQEIDR